MGIELSAASMLAIYSSAATTALSYVEQSQSANAQQDAINANYKQQMQTVQEQYRQTDGAAREQMSERALEAQRALAHLRVMSGEAGVGGFSSARLYRESQQNAAADIATIEANRINTNNQTALEARAMRSGAASQLSQIRQPSLIGSGLQIAGAYIDQEAKTEALNGGRKTEPYDYNRMKAYKPDSLRGGR